jgi:hypothetical protein
MVTPYVKNINIFSCPSDIANFTWADQKMARSSYALNAYAYRFHGGNLNSNDIGPGPMFMEISRPAERIMLTESSNGLDGVALWCFRGPQLNHEREQNSCTLKRGRLVTLAFDGHAKSFKMRGLLDNVPYTNIKSDCSQNARCIEQNYPEWAPWSK